MKHFLKTIPHFKVVQDTGCQKYLPFFKKLDIILERLHIGQNNPVMGKRARRGEFKFKIIHRVFYYLFSTSIKLL